MAPISIMMNVFIKDSGRRMRDQAKECLIMRKAAGMRACGSMTTNKVRASNTMEMELPTKVISPTTWETEKAHFITTAKNKWKESGNRASWQEKATCQPKASLIAGSSSKERNGAEVKQPLRMEIVTRATGRRTSYMTKVRTAGSTEMPTRENSNRDGGKVRECTSMKTVTSTTENGGTT